MAVMNPAGHYSYSNAATLFTLSDIGVSAHRYHNRLDVFTRAWKTAPPSLVSTSSCSTPKGRPWRRQSDSQGHVTLQTDKEAALLLARKEGRRRCSISSCRRWIWRNSLSQGRPALANSSLCLARAISIGRAKR
ncbi:hypothetical protein LNO36_22035 [Klebsiella variicola subsp. variicola]|nr:hypothetical protein [Klebsiella variicola subsp. variicola]